MDLVPGPMSLFDVPSRVLDASSASKFPLNEDPSAVVDDAHGMITSLWAAARLVILLEISSLRCP